MIKIGITGNIASGKSQVENIIESLGYKVTDADKINRFLLENDNYVIEKIKQEFRNYDIIENNNISRKKLANIIFNSEEKKKILENILHKKIFEKINEFYYKNKDEKFVFVSMALLFETNSQSNFDKIIFVSSNENIRFERLLKRNNINASLAKKIINSQGKEELKINKSDYIIYNNSDLVNLRNQTEDTLQQLFYFYAI